MQIYCTVDEVLNVLSEVKEFSPKFFVDAISFSDVSIKQLNHEELKVFSYYENNKSLSVFCVKRSIYGAIVHNSVTYFRRRPFLFSKIQETLELLKLNK